MCTSSYQIEGIELYEDVCSKCKKEKVNCIEVWSNLEYLFICAECFMRIASKFKYNLEEKTED